MTIATFIGLLKLELPGHDALLCDGGTVTFGGEQYLSRDDVVGVIASVDPLEEGVGGGAPAGVVTFIPPSEVTAGTLIAPAVQNARLRMWVGEIDDTTGALIGTPTQMADWLVDVPKMRFTREGRELELLCVGFGERLFQIDRGNSLSATFHKSVHPGELGLDNATGVATSVPWGAPSAPRGLSGGFAGGNFGGGGNQYEQLK